MKTAFPCSAVKIFMLFLGYCFLVGCDEKSGGTELSAMKFQGEATLEYLEKPGFFGAKGSLLSFEEFSLADGIDKTYILKNIPVFENSYGLYFFTGAKLNNDLTANIQMTTALEDSNGRRYWGVEAPLSQWSLTETGGRPEDTYYHYMRFTEMGVVKCAFRPSVNSEYRLYVKCKASNPGLTETMTNKNMRFRLRAGGFK